ncbi:hypothetical protein GF358_00810 [Candidatus Woesearchaeota archaeon]|nr:hypothetical protein [Candidatus Woesearchaeota archaeon]
MTTVSLLQKLIDFVYGALIFLILIGILFAVYHIFWAEKLTVPEQNLDSVFNELKDLEKGDCFKVVVRQGKEAHTLHLLDFGNTAPECGQRPCLCVRKTGEMKCRPIPGVSKNCDAGICGVSDPRFVNILPSYADVNICNKGNKLYFG